MTDIQAIARPSDETFDDFLASENLLAPCEEDAIKEIIAGISVTLHQIPNSPRPHPSP